MEVAKYGIRVNCIHPGNIKAELNRSKFEDPENLRKIFPKIPQGKISTPEDIAKLPFFWPAIGRIMSMGDHCLLMADFYAASQSLWQMNLSCCMDN